MMIWNRLQISVAGAPPQGEREMRAELESLTAIAGGKELGNLTLAMEDARATWGWTWLESIFVDYPLFTPWALARQPAFVAVAVLSLALAIGANSAHLQLRRRAAPAASADKESSDVFDVSGATPDNPGEGMSFPDYRDIRDKNRSLSAWRGVSPHHPGVASNPAAPAQIRFASLVRRQLLSGRGRDGFNRACFA